MTDRRYSDEEVAAIFAKAVEAEAPQIEPAVRTGGLSLADLQDIGRDVGIAPDVVARAAQLVEAGEPASARTMLGFPIAVERTVMLNRRLTDAEWELLVVKLRDAFDARGRVSAYGSFRQWTNGNLQALLEPTETGHRLRLRTRKASAQFNVRIGLAMFGMSALVVMASALQGQLAGAVPGATVLAAMGGAIIAGGLLPLRQWARTRSRQMEAIAEEVGQPLLP